MKVTILMTIFCCVASIIFGAGQSFQGLDFHVNAISGDGKVLLSSDYIDPAFRWSKSNGYEYLGYLPRYTFTNPKALSYDGSVIVGTCVGALGIQQTFRWSETEGLVGLGEFGNGSNAWGVSADGSVVVGSIPGGSHVQAFRWTETNGMEILGDLMEGGYTSHATAVSADGSVIVGQSIDDDGNGNEAFIYTTAGGMVGLGSLVLGGNSSWATAISADGSTVVGTSGSPNYVLESFRSYGIGMIGLGSVWGYNENHATDVSGDGSIIVGYGYQGGTGNQRAMIWDIVNGMRDLNEVLVSDYDLDLNGWILKEVVGISDDGLTMIGRGINPEGVEQDWICTVPEPCTVLLLGLGGLLIKRRI